MATYPSLLTLRDSTDERDAGIVPARATNGALRVRVMYPTDKRSFEVRHLLTSAERATLEAFYQSEKLADVSYRWPADGVTYTVRFVAAPQYRRTGDRFEAVVRLMEA